MPIISGGGGGGLPAGWTESGSPADVTTHGGAIDAGSGTDQLNLNRYGLFVQGANAALAISGLLDDTFLVQHDVTGQVIIGADAAAPADGDLSPSSVGLWFDGTNGASALKLKGKSANGTVVTATIALA